MNQFYFILIAFVLFTGCKSASKSYQKGDYADAIELGVKKLQKDPYDRETLDIVKNAYQFAVTSHESQIRVLNNSRNDNRFEKIFQHYVSLQDLYNTISAYPAVSRQVNPVDYSEYVETFRDRSASVYIERADELIALQTKQGYRDAYYELNKALRFTNNYQLKRKRDSVYQAALNKVVIIPMLYYGNVGGYQNNYQLQQFQNEVLRTLAQNRNNEFVRFYSEWEARSQQVEPDQFLELNLNRVIIGRPVDRRNTREVTKEVVVKEIVHKPDSITKQYGTVRARITTTDRNLLSEADLIITLRDSKGRIIWNDRFTGHHQWRTQFSTYTGDERALSQNDLQLVNRQEEQMPREEWIMEELYRQIQQDLHQRLRSYYSRY